MVKLCTSYTYQYKNDIKPNILKKSYSIGRYKVEYNMYEFEYYGSGSYKGGFEYYKDYDEKVYIYEDDKLIITNTHDPCHEIIMGGDGLTRETTYYLLPNTGRYGAIYDMNEKFIRDVHDAGDRWYATFRMNDTYYLTMGYDMCTHYIYLGVCNSKILFETTADSEQTRPYDNARIGLSTDNFENYNPCEATEEGIIVERYSVNKDDFIIGDTEEIFKFTDKQNRNDKSFYGKIDNYGDWKDQKCICYKVTREEVKLVKYEDIEHFDFDIIPNKDPLEDMLKFAGINITDDNKEKINATINSQLVTKGGTVCIPVDMLKELA